MAPVPEEMLGRKPLRRRKPAVANMDLLQQAVGHDARRVVGDAVMAASKQLDRLAA